MSGRRHDISGKELNLPFVREIGYHDYNHTVPLRFHSHPAGLELTFVLKGSVDWLLEDGRRYRQSGNTLFVMPPDLVHKGMDSIIAPCHLFWMVLEFQAADPILPEELRQLLIGLLKERELQNCFLTPHLHHELERTVGAVKKNRTDPLFHKELQIQLYALLLKLIEQLRQPISPGKSLLRRAEEYIEQNIRKPISVAELAAGCKVSESCFFVRFKEESGLTPLDFLLRKKLEHADRRLRESSRSVTEIAFEFGFSSSQYFSVVFKRYFGCSPGERRRNTN